ncbi:MAG: dockerin type I repeat-containing protein [Oscillospiraceae bacterium]|nr:dockerin type I repeat-containing protein [Oscillospiraceae bacterium]
MKKLIALLFGMTLLLEGAAMPAAAAEPVLPETKTADWYEIHTFENVRTQETWDTILERMEGQWTCIDGVYYSEPDTPWNSFEPYTPNPGTYDRSEALLALLSHAPDAQFAVTWTSWIDDADAAQLRDEERGWLETAGIESVVLEVGTTVQTSYAVLDGATLLEFPAYEKAGYQIALATEADAAYDVKDWEHYAALNDYAVYHEYCQWKGIEPAETLPARRDLPDSDRFYYEGYALFDEMHAVPDEAHPFTEADETAHLADASYYGFPGNWIAEAGLEDAPLHVSTHDGSVCFTFNGDAEETSGIRSNFINCYRIQLTLLNSAFAKEHPIGSFASPRPEEGTVQRLGDINASGAVEILDVILVNKAMLGSVTLTEAQKYAADVDQNGTLDTTDTLMILKEIVKLTQEFEAP